MLRYHLSSRGRCESPLGHADAADPGRKKRLRQKLITAERIQVVATVRSNEIKHEERRRRGDGEVPESGQRQRPAGCAALRGGGAGVRLPCLLLRVDSE